jgi:hypothetical protein
VRLIKTLFRYNKPWTSILWDPHMGLWNRQLLRVIRPLLPRPIFERVHAMIAFIDTIILFGRALGRRISKIGLSGLVSTPRVPEGISLLYFDLGTHKKARELDVMVEKILPRLCGDDFKAYGFEASSKFSKRARAKFVGRQNVTIINRALCQELPSDGKLKLYKDSRHGLGNSIYKHLFAEHEEVKAIKFSDWFQKRLQKQDFDLNKSIFLLRMNIEGAEFDVVSDLIDSGLNDYIDGYFGMWNDLAKIDSHRDDEFRVLLAKNHISPFTFNGRDLASRFRLKCIEYEAATSVQVGLRRIRNGLKENVQLVESRSA